MQSNKAMIHKLQTAINMHGGCILIDKIQFYSAEQDRPISLYKICEPGEYINPEKNARRRKDILFTTPSQIQVVLFLRDYWYHMNDKEIPTDNEMWEQIKKEKGIVFE